MSGPFTNTDAAAHEIRLAALERQLEEAKLMIARRDQDNSELAKAVESMQRCHSPREVGAVNAAMGFISACQHSLDGCNSSGELEPRELLPEESAAFSAACDMLSRFFDNEFQVKRKVSPEASEK
jgi:hypothetical protein